MTVGAGPTVGWGPDPASEKLKGVHALGSSQHEERAAPWWEWFLPGATTLARVLRKYPAALSPKLLTQFLLGVSLSPRENPETERKSEKARIERQRDRKQTER